MAQRVHVVLEDDLDGGPADETVHFGLDGSAYEIDLSSGRAEQLRAAVALFVSSARPAGRGPGKSSRRSRSGASSGVNTEAVRAWAVAQGIVLKRRGRIPVAVLEQYRSAH